MGTGDAFASQVGDIIRKDGQQIPIGSARPGDLIFYARGGYVYHVSMYIGNGQVVQAYSSSRGIIISEIGPNAVWATNVLG